MRWAKRTQVKIGLTCASPCGPACALETLMPRATLPTWPRTNHELDLRRVALANGAQSCLGEVAIDPKGIGVDDADLVRSHGRVVAELRQQVGHPTVDRRADLRAPEIDLGLLALRLGLRKARLGAGALNLQRFDLPFSQFERCLRALHRRLLFSLLSAVLLCALNGAVAFLRQILVAHRLLLREHQRRLRLLHLGLARVHLRLLYIDLR